MDTQKKKMFKAFLNTLIAKKHMNSKHMNGGSITLFVLGMD